MNLAKQIQFTQEVGAAAQRYNEALEKKLKANIKAERMAELKTWEKAARMAGVSPEMIVNIKLKASHNEII